MSSTPSALGLMVPDFAAAATDGEFALAARRGKALVIYFYPKDNTPGCTTEAMQFRDLHTEFVAADGEVVGVSRDSLKSHLGFRTKLGLPFQLIADTDERVCRLFGVIKAKKLYGKEVQGVERSTFLIDSSGVLRKEWRGVKADGHAQAVLAALREL